MRKRSRANIDDLSSSLRQAYQSTLEESIPDSIMDLLRKLD
jgi:Anti-sigma factor NepR